MRQPHVCMVQELARPLGRVYTQNLGLLSWLSLFLHSPLTFQQLWLTWNLASPGSVSQKDLAFCVGVLATAGWWLPPVIRVKAAEWPSLSFQFQPPTPPGSASFCLLSSAFCQTKHFKNFVQSFTSYLQEGWGAKLEFAWNKSLSFWRMGKLMPREVKPLPQHHRAYWVAVLGPKLRLLPNPNPNPNQCSGSPQYLALALCLE